MNRMPPTSIQRVAMRWTPAGNWRRGRPKETRRMSVERDMELEPGRKAGSGQNKMAFLGVGLMCEQARRGLSK